MSVGLVLRPSAIIESLALGLRGGDQGDQVTFVQESSDRFLLAARGDEGCGQRGGARGRGRRRTTLGGGWCDHVMGPEQTRPATGPAQQDGPVPIERRSATLAPVGGRKRKGSVS